MLWVNVCMRKSLQLCHSQFWGYIENFFYQWVWHLWRQMGKREEGNEWCLLNSFQVRNKVLVIFFMIIIDIFNNISSILNDLYSHMSGRYEGWDYNSKALNFLRRWLFLGARSSFIRKGFQNVPVNAVHKMLNFSFFEVGSLI